MRAVLDTNILISGTLWRGAPHQCLLAAQAALYEMVLAEPILDELREKLILKFGNSVEEAEEIIGGLRDHSTIVDLAGRSGWVVTDPDDDKFVEAALVGGADVIVSGDRHLLQLGTIERIPICTAREFVDRLAQSED